LVGRNLQHIPYQVFIFRRVIGPLHHSQPGFEVIETALAREAGERDLYITKHRGYCSFLEPDLESEWFRRYRPGEGEVESVVRVKTCSVDEFASARRLDVDFLKVDTEGTELEVLQGAARQLSSTVQGIRVNVNFQACYRNHSLFPEVHDYLVAKGFFLLNLDYFGRGVPRNGLFRKPDPLSQDDLRYGILIGTDGVWLKHYDRLCEQYKTEERGLAYATLKYAYFCMLNYAPDVGFDTLLNFVRDRNGVFGSEVIGSELYRALRRACAQFLGNYRVYPDFQWDLARSFLKTIFGLELEAGHKYWELIQRL